VDGLEGELRAANESLRRLDARRTAQMEYRDDVLLRAIVAGATWVRVQEVTGLTPRGVQLALRRAREHQIKDAGK
jgi:ribosomal protein S18